MKTIKGILRWQMQFNSLDAFVEKPDPVAAGLKSLAAGKTVAVKK